MKQLLITGHKGFIGSQLIKYLQEQEYFCVGLDRRSGKDILDCKLPTDIDCVIHLAGEAGVQASLKDPARYWRTNVEGSRRLFDFYSDVPIFTASSSSIYEPYRNPYAMTKLAMEQIPHTQITHMRFHTVYSATPRKDMFWDLLLNNRLEYVNRHTRDFIHLDDVCSAVHMLIESKPRAFVNWVDIGTGKSVKLTDLAPKVPVRLHTKTAHERENTCADVAYLHSLGWRPKWTAQEFLSSFSATH